MALKVVCIACFEGDHDNHRHVVKAPPKGGVGGDVCDCKGECRDNPPARTSFDCGRVLASQLAAAASRQTKEA